MKQRKSVSKIYLYGLANCDTVKKARAWLGARDIGYAFHDYKKSGVDVAALRRWVGEVGWEALLNRRGTTFRKLASALTADLDELRAMDLMVSHPSAIRRPVVEGAGALLVGFDEAAWTQAFEG